MERDVRLYFRKILNSFSWGAIWMLVMSTLGFFFRLAFIRGGIEWYNILFYVIAAGTLALLLRYFYRTWR